MTEVRLKSSNENQNSQKKLFFGLFVFPAVIAVGMAVLLCSIVLLTREEETPESLITEIKTGAPSKRWQKAYELSNELNRKGGIIRSAGIMKEVIHVLNDREHYDAKTRAYMAMALAKFQSTEAEAGLVKALNSVDEREEESTLPIFLMWSIGRYQNPQSAAAVSRFLTNEQADLRKTAAYVLGVLGNREAIPGLRRAIEDSVPDVQWNAALALARLGDDSGWQVLIQMLDRHYLQSVLQLNEDQTEQAMVNAARGLGLLHRAEAKPILETVSQTDRNLKVRQATLSALELSGHHAVLN